eukprot:TRINITY_DN4621_c0_g1_i1.p1 TRINITY_DN4621_c0_g1~~TRINITY_DN4621_c0_g1_i1.p1  ORF type:complete len:230 (-),score=40.09 TRINITY_DN4621_c0_g1_i1:281-970(-)
MSVSSTPPQTLAPLKLKRVDEDNTDATYKIVIVGDSTVGKTNLFNRFDKGIFSPKAETTIGADFITKTYLMPDGQYVRIQFWDTAGQERFMTVTKAYYRGAQGAIIVYDITNEVSFQRAAVWLKELQLHSYNESLSCMLIGNKSDLKASRQVSTEAAKEFAQDNDMIFFEASACTNQNVLYSFEYFFEKLHLNYSESSEENSKGAESHGIELQPDSTPSKADDNPCSCF